MGTALRKVSETACRRLLEPLADIFLLLGIGAGEFSDLAKEAHVHAAARRLRRNSTRANQSRIAIATGLTRAEVKRIMSSKAGAGTRYLWHRNRAARVMDGWFTDRDFKSKNGHPKRLPLRGTRGSFQSLVSRYAGDIPVRAMLDELVESGAVTRLGRGLLRATRRSLVNVDLKSSTIQDVGERTRALLTTLAHNLRHPESPLLEQSVVSGQIAPEVAEYLMNFVTKRATALLQIVGDQFERPPRKTSRITRRSKKLGFAMFLHEG